MASMSKGYSAKIGLDISDVDKKVNSLSRELKTIDNSLKTNGDSAALLSQRYTVMGEKAQALSEKLKLLEGARSDVMNAFNNGEISSEDLRSYEREVENTKGELKGLIPSLGDLSKAFDVLGEGLKKVTQLTAAFVKESIEVGKQFESSMSQVAATMAIDKLSEDYEKLSEKAKEMGATTRFTAAEAADALNYLALAGYSAEQAMDALPKVLSLAQAGGMELARASDMITDTISALHLQKTDMDTLIDQMAKTAQRSNTSVSQLGDALLTLGGTAASIAARNGGLAEINSLLGILADNGIKASEGGTHLRNILLKMSKPTKNMKNLMETLNMEFYDFEGNLRPIPEIFLEMKQKMDDMGMTQAEKDSLINKAFNPTDIASVNALLGTTADRFEGLANEIQNANGAASAMSDTMNQNLDGALRTLNSAKEAVEVEFYEKINEPLAQIVNNVATALQDISAEISGSSFGEEFTVALQKIADATKEALPKVIDLFKKFSEEVVPKLGDVAIKIVDITADEVLPRLLDMFEWLIDHSSEVETGLKMIITAMAAGKVMDFTNSLFGTVTQLTNVATGATNAAGAISGATANMGAQAGALGGAGGLIAKMNLYALAIEAVAAAALLAAEAIDKAADAKMRDAKYLNGFTDASNATWDEYRYTAAGKYDDRTIEQADRAISDTKKHIDETQQQIFDLNDKINELNGRKRSLERQKDAAGILWGIGDTKEAKNSLDAVEKELEAAEKKTDELRVELEANNSLLHEQEESRDRIEEKQKLSNKKDYLIQKAEEERKLREEGAAREEQRKEADRLHALGKSTEEEKKAFAELLAAQEEEWDEQYNWDKKNHDEYWREREQFLKENKVESKEWYDAWNETQAQLGKIDDKTKKEIGNNLKDAEKEVKDKLTTFKNGLALAVAEKRMTEWEANEKLGEYLRNNLDQTSDLYTTEYTAYLNKQEEISKKLDKEQDDLYQKEVKAQKELVKDKFQELENQAKADGWSDRKLWNEKFRLLKQYKKDGTIYIETYDEYHQELINDQADILEDERNAREKQAEKDKAKDEASLKKINEERKKIFEDAEKEAEDIIAEYYKSSRDEITRAARSSQTVTDAKGRERLILTDYKKKLQELKAYQKNLEKLKSMGLTNEHLKEIFSMDLDTRMKYISELVNMGGEQRARYLRDYNNYQKAADSTAKTEMSVRSNEIQQEVLDRFNELAKDSELSGEEAAKKWQEGWEKGMKGYDLGIDFLPSEITSGAAAYDKSQQDGFRKLMNFTTSVLDLNNQLLGTEININIDNKKNCVLTFRDLLKQWQNSGSKAMG